MADAIDQASFPALFKEETVLLGFEAAEKKDVLVQLADVLVEGGSIQADERDTVLDALIAREGLGSTGIGAGIAIPHVKMEGIEGTITAIGVSKKPVDYKAVDAEPCDLFFVLISSTDQADRHLKILRWLSALVRNQDFVRFMRGSRDRAEAVSLLAEMG